MKDIPTSPRIMQIKRNRRMRRLRFSILFFILIVLIIGGLAYFSSNKHVVIDKIEINGTHVINNEDVEEKIRQDISGKYLYIFSKSNVFIYPEKKIYNNLISNFPRIESLSIHIDNLRTLKIDIIERTGSYLYCGVSIPEEKEEVGENCYFINNDGLIFDKAPYFSGNVYFKYYVVPVGGVDNPLGKQMLSVERFHQLARFIDGIANLGFKPIYILIEEDGTNSLYLENSSGGIAPKIIFKTENDLEVILNNFALSMKKKEFANEINGKYNTLLYIDLRFKNKVLYKFQ
jgi:hypothetical protein